VGDLPLVLLFANKIILATDFAVQIQMPGGFNPPVTQRNRFVSLALEFRLVVRNATVFGLYRQLCHQVNRFLIDRQQLDQPSQISLDLITGDRAILHTAGHAGFVLVPANTVGVSPPGEPST